MSAYYNEFDPGAAAWLRELIKAGHIADGEVDERSITDVDAADLGQFDQCHFFAGIGGWSLALRLAGWPDDRQVWTGSPPCQPFSAAGQRAGKDDERHLAPHFLDLVRACRPRVLLGEQVASAAVFGKAAKSSRSNAVSPPEWAWLDDVSDRLEAAHYAVGAVDFPSAGVGAPHIRQRTYFAGLALERLGHCTGAGSLPGAQRGIHRCEEGAGPWHGEPERSGSAGVLADGCQRGRAAYAVAGLHHAEPDPEPCGSFGGLSEPDGRERNGLAEHGEHVADWATSGRQQRDSEPARHREANRPAPLHGFWADADWLGSRDGKWRPVEPGTFPLAHGLSGRVGLLRGYGNAINPRQAAVFIESVIELA